MTVKVAAIELTYLDVPFTAHTGTHMQYWLPWWRIVQICKITLDNGVVGWGETIPNYTHAQVPDDIQDRIIGVDAADILWKDDLGAGVQQALFDAVGKNENVAAYSLLGNKIREWCPISWWAMDMGPKDWARQCKEAVAKGYVSTKLKARSWQDLHACLQAIFRVVPKQFKLDLDFNGTLVNSANAVELLKSLEQYQQVAMIESPIPQDDVSGNRHIRSRFNRPLAMHFGSPPIMTTLAEDLTDGFVVGGGAAQLRNQDPIANAANKPYWLQLVGTGITTTWAAHIGAVSNQAKWPAITCMNIWKSQLLKRPIEVRGGYYPVPDGPGLGIEIDQPALKKFKVNYSYIDVARHIYRYTRASGETIYIACDRTALHGRYTEAGLPICEQGSQIEIISDDGSKKFANFYEEVTKKKILFRRETSQKKK